MIRSLSRVPRCPGRGSDQDGRGIGTPGRTVSGMRVRHVRAGRHGVTCDMRHGGEALI